MATADAGTTAKQNEFPYATRRIIGYANTVCMSHCKTPSEMIGSNEQIDEANRRQT